MSKQGRERGRDDGRKGEKGDDRGVEGDGNGGERRGGMFGWGNGEAGRRVMTKDAGRARWSGRDGEAGGRKGEGKRGGSSGKQQRKKDLCNYWLQVSFFCRNIVKTALHVCKWPLSDPTAHTHTRTTEFWTWPPPSKCSRSHVGISEQVIESTCSLALGCLTTRVVSKLIDVINNDTANTKTNTSRANVYLNCSIVTTLHFLVFSLSFYWHYN